MKVKGQGNPSSQGGWNTIIELPMNDQLYHLPLIKTTISDQL